MRLGMWSEPPEFFAAWVARMGKRKTLARISSGGGQAFEGNRKRNRMGMQKFVSEDGSVGEKEAFIGDWAWNRKCREKSDGKRGRRPPYFPAAPLIMPYYLLGATILRAFVGKKIK